MIAATLSRIPIQQGGWIGIDKLEEYGARLGERTAAGLGRGLGAWWEMRFEVKAGKGGEGDNEKTLIMITQEYAKISERRRGFTSTEARDEE